MFPKGLNAVKKPTKPGDEGKPPVWIIYLDKLDGQKQVFNIKVTTIPEGREKPLPPVVVDVKECREGENENNNVL